MNIFLIGIKSFIDILNMFIDALIAVNQKILVDKEPILDDIKLFTHFGFIRN